MASKGTCRIVMSSNLLMSFFLLLVLLFYLSMKSCSASKSCLEKGLSIRDEDTTSSNRSSTLSSPGNVFVLGFFTPNGSANKNRYLGIWYKNYTSTKIVVWVANRDKPLVDYNASLTISGGQATLLDRNGLAHWGCGTYERFNRSMKLCLSDRGELSFSRNQLNPVWQSFNQPTDTFLPGMFGGESIDLISWRSPSLPATGDFTLQLQQNFLVVSKAGLPFWKNTNTPEKEMPRRLIDLLLLQGEMMTPNIRLVIHFTGRVQLWEWDNNSGIWSLTWSEPKDRCSTYAVCGIFGSCNSYNGWLCKCLPGFKPVNPAKWAAQDFSDGCGPKSQSCERKSVNDSMFLTLPMMNIPVDWSPNSEGQSTGLQEDCKAHCLENCNCAAYSYNASYCKTWKFSEITGLQEESSEGITLHIRTTHSDIDCRDWLHTTCKPAKDGKKRCICAHSKKWDGLDFTCKKTVDRGFHVKILIACLAAVLAIVLLAGVVFIYRKRRISRETGSDKLTGDDSEQIDLPFYGWESILSATNNFADENKLGTGGFGSVYKGNLSDGQEIAVKRLSTVSVHGIEEFRTEVLLIAKLQHRNLVRLLGYCVKADEKILVYEYMPNGSLDSCLFNETLSVALDWEKRFEIISGIARGVLYLHQDSRLRIIHRDLKPSNILLDDDLNPKISDFGIARIVQGKHTESSTIRVVGTYGYMSPEYAHEGIFSVKSDVFSFGVVVLETISGRRNSRIFIYEHGLSLLGHAWKLWNEDRGMELADQALKESCNISQVLKCIQIALLCIQQDPGDRPTMSGVVLMLSSDDANLPPPKQPAFSSRDPHLDNLASSSTVVDSSSNDLPPIIYL